MSEQDIQTPPVEADTSIEAAPEGDTRPLVDYEQRYNSLRPEFDRTKQQLKEYEARLAEYEASLQQPEPDDDEFEEYDFEDSVARQRLEALEARIAQREEAETLKAQQADEAAFIDSEIESIEKDTEDELSDAESNWIGNYALANRDEHGNPDVRAAYKAYTDMIEARRSKWVQTKKVPRPGSGAAAKEKIKLDTPDDRSRYMAERLSELDA